MKTLLVWILLTACAAAQVNIDSVWLAGKSAPYYLDQANATYILQQDISSSGTAFAAIASGITLDLNGHKVTYNSGGVCTVPNGSFEVDGDWTLSGNATLAAGDYLQSQVHLGSRSLRFSTPCPNQYVESAGTVTLAANTQYSFSAMLQKGAGTPVAPIVLWCELIGVSGEPTRRIEKGSNNTRGIQFTDITINTGSVPETYRVRVGISGAASVVAGAAFVDDVRIVPANYYGIAVGSTTSAASVHPGITRRGTAEGFRVLNGSIVQGVADGRECSAILDWGSNNVHIDRVALEVRGPLTKAIWVQSGGPMHLASCKIQSDVLTVRSRDQFDASMVGNNFYGTVTACEFLNGPHAGIRTISTQPSVISGNVFRMRNRFTNGFAIGARGPGTIVARNRIENIGEYNGRGIQVSGESTAGMKVIDNIVAVQSLPLNQEYHGQLAAYGIQCETSADCLISGNHVTAIGDLGEAAAFRANNDPVNTQVIGNTFVAIQKTPGVDVSCVQFTNVHSELGNVFAGNTLRTNKNFVGGTDNCSDVVWSGTVLEIAEPASADARWFESIASKSNATQLIQWKWIDNIYTSQRVADAFASGAWMRTGYPQYDVFSSYTVAFTVDVLGVPAVYDALTVAGSGVLTLPAMKTEFSYTVGGVTFTPSFGLLVR